MSVSKMYLFIFIKVCREALLLFRLSGGMFQCNIAAMVSMCQIVMPGMCEQRRGVVINIGSTAGDIPSPLLAVYGASKVTAFYLYVHTSVELAK